MTVTELNTILARELGCTPYSEGIFQWNFSEDLFWPAMFTGRTIEKTTPGGIIYMEREYKPTRMTNKRNVWMVTRWFPPEALSNWLTNFPGADYPSRGYRVHTDYICKPGVLPAYDDTQTLIYLLRQQMDQTFTEATDMFDEADKKERAATSSQIADEVRDDFTAFLNVEPGKRGGSVSLPSLQRDIVLPPDAKAN